MAEMKLPMADFVRRIVGDPSSPPRTRMLTGFLGDSHQDGKVRVYGDAELSSWVDVPKDAILECQKLADDPLGGARIWVKGDVQIDIGSVAYKPTDVVGEDPPTTWFRGEEGPMPTTFVFGEEDPTTLYRGEEGPQPTTLVFGEEDPTTLLRGEEGPQPTTLVQGEEGPQPTTLIRGEEDPRPTTLVTGEEGPGPTTLAIGEEDPGNPFGGF